jgi:Tfp pilus assembly protein PilN
MQDHENIPQMPEQSDSTVSESENIEKSRTNENDVAIISDDNEPVVLKDEEEETPKEESPARKTFRKFIRWTVGLLVVFGLGFLLSTFMIYNPKVDELNQSQSTLEDANTTISELETQIRALQGEIGSLNAQIDSLSQQVTTLEEEKQVIKQKENNYNLQISLLKARVDVVSAQVELFNENSAQARVLLENTGQSLATIETLLPDDLKDVVAPLQNRLELAIGEITTDPQTAIADLDILAGDLLEIENALFND